MGIDYHTSFFLVADRQEVLWKKRKPVLFRLADSSRYLLCLPSLSFLETSGSLADSRCAFGLSVCLLVCGYIYEGRV